MNKTVVQPGLLAESETESSMLKILHRPGESGTSQIEVGGGKKNIGLDWTELDWTVIGWEWNTGIKLSKEKFY